MSARLGTRLWAAEIDLTWDAYHRPLLWCPEFGGHSNQTCLLLASERLQG